MKLLTSIDEIHELTSKNVHIRNREELVNKLNKIIKGGHENLQVVTDFDHTLTRHVLDDGTEVLSSFGMFRECPSVPQHYKDEDIRLSEIYKPIESDPTMKTEEKIKHMIEWYLAANKTLTGVKFPRNELKDIALKVQNCLRIGVKDLIQWSEQQQVPVLVFSAGLGEAVVAVLKAANFMMPHVKVISNFLALDENDTIVGIKGDVIHTYNKNEAAIKGTEYYEMVKNRGSVLLMGDNIGDAGMAEGMEHCDAVLKVGFLGRQVEANLRNYLDKFDIVLVNDSTFDVVNAILKRVQ